MIPIQLGQESMTWLTVSKTFLTNIFDCYQFEKSWSSVITKNVSTMCCYDSASLGWMCKLSHARFNLKHLIYNNFIVFILHNNGQLWVQVCLCECLTWPTHLWWRRHSQLQRTEVSFLWCPPTGPEMSLLCGAETETWAQSPPRLVSQYFSFHEPHPFIFSLLHLLSIDRCLLKSK